MQRAEGNPFFVEEVLQSWVDRALLRRDRRTARRPPTCPAGVDVPETVQGIIAARIDLLPALEKHALQAAAVIGRTFWEGAVRELVGAATPDFGCSKSATSSAAAAGPSLEAEREHLFKHELTREVAYRSLPTSRRARLHAGFAEWLERRDAGADRHAALLAHHYAEAVAPEERVGPRPRRAGGAARERRPLAAPRRRAGARAPRDERRRRAVPAGRGA